MHEQLENTIQTNLQIALKRLHKEKDLVIDEFVSLLLKFEIEFIFRQQKIVLLNIPINLMK